METKRTLFWRLRRNDGFVIKRILFTVLIAIPPTTFCCPTATTRCRCRKTSPT